VPSDVEAAFVKGLQAPVPLIIGTNSAEFWWMKPSDPTAYGALDDGFSAEQHSALIEAYGGQAGIDGHLVSDMVFNEPARHLARLHAAAGYPTWLYRFDVVSAAMPEPHEGATHASERPYVFDNLQHSSWPTEAMDQRAASLMAGYWSGFALSGDPNGGERPLWPDYRRMPDHLLEFNNAGAVAKPVPFHNRLDLIESIHDAVRAEDMATRQP
jgi:para-nitrobenzyl esterase